MLTLQKLTQDLAAQSLTSRELIERCLSEIENTHGEGRRAFLTVYKEQALNEADLVDQARAKGLPLAPFSGIPIAIKDLFDVAGEVTRAGSRVLDNQAAATADAAIVTALRRAGFILIGKNNMTEFAYSGLGMNPHFGTPLCPFEREIGRIPGGSSSGAAVSVFDAMTVAGIGTDTGGSCRIPAAFCGVVGFKPTSHRVSREGAVPLSTSLDSIGPLANSVDCCARIDSVLSGGAGQVEAPSPVQQLHIGVLGGYVTEQMDENVARSYESALARMSAAGVRLTQFSIAELSDLPEINAKGGLVGAEAYAWHRPLLETRDDFYDPWVKARLNYSANQTAADYIDLLNHRKRLIHAVTDQSSQFDVIAMPTVQIIPPTIESLSDPTESNRINQLCLRNTSIGNFLNRPAISVPCHASGMAPVGFMLMGKTREDRKLLSVAASLENLVKNQ